MSSVEVYIKPYFCGLEYAIMNYGVVATLGNNTITDTLQE